jgi:hypothetical protein
MTLLHSIRLTNEKTSIYSSSINFSTLFFLKSGPWGCQAGVPVPWATPPNPAPFAIHIFHIGFGFYAQARLDCDQVAGIAGVCHHTQLLLTRSSLGVFAQAVLEPWSASGVAGITAVSHHLLHTQNNVSSRECLCTVLYSPQDWPVNPPHNRPLLIVF